MSNYCIFTDGSCRANKNGGIGIVWLKNGKKVLEYSKDAFPKLGKGILTPLK